MENLIEQFKGKKKAIQCKTEEEFERMKKIFEGLGFNCKGIDNYYKGFNCLNIELNHPWYGDEDFYKREGFEIIDSTEIQEETPKIKVIKVKSKEHFKRVVEYLKKLTDIKECYIGTSVGDYYGIDLSGRINFWEEEELLLFDNFEIIELPEEEKELPIPRKVLVRDSDSQEWLERLLVADLSNLGLKLTRPYIVMLHSNDADDCIKYRQMKELPQPTELTKEEAEKKLKELTGEEYKII